MAARHYAILSISAAALLPAACGSDQDRFPTITYEMKTIERRFGTEGDTVNGFAYLNVTYPEVTAASERGVADSVSARVWQFLLRPMAGAGTFETVDDMAKEFIRNFKDRPDPARTASYGWTWLRKARVETDTLGILGVSLVETRYQGPEDQHAERRYVNFDARTGRLLALSDLLIPGGDTLLNRTAEQAFRRARRLDLVESLAAAGFAFDSTAGFRHNGNFLITPKGLAFYVNRGEAGKEELGPTGYTVPYTDLAALARPDGPLTPFVAPPPGL